MDVVSQTVFDHYRQDTNHQLSLLRNHLADEINIRGRLENQLANLENRQEQLINVLKEFIDPITLRKLKREIVK